MEVARGETLRVVFAAPTPYRASQNHLFSVVVDVLSETGVSVLVDDPAADRLCFSPKDLEVAVGFSGGVEGTIRGDAGEKERAFGKGEVSRLSGTEALRQLTGAGVSRGRYRLAFSCRISWPGNPGTATIDVSVSIGQVGRAARGLGRLVVLSASSAVIAPLEEPGQVALRPTPETLRRVHLSDEPDISLSLIEDTKEFGFCGVVWDSGVAIARHLLADALSRGSVAAALTDGAQRSILELGSGTGVVGLALARLFVSNIVCLTDEQDMVPLLERNAHASGCRNVACAPHRWGQPLGEAVHKSRQFSCVVASDIMYDPGCWDALLVSTAAALRGSHGGIALIGGRYRQAGELGFVESIVASPLAICCCDVLSTTGELMRSFSRKEGLRDNEHEVEGRAVLDYLRSSVEVGDILLFHLRLAGESVPRGRGMEEAVEVLKAAFLQMAPVDRVHGLWLDAERQSAGGVRVLQDAFVSRIVEAEPFRSSPPEKAYVHAVLKRIIRRIEHASVEIHEGVLRLLLQCQSLSAGAPFERAHISIFPPASGSRQGGALTLTVAPRHNEVGLRAWEAGVRLTELCVEIDSIVAGAEIVELGAGVGITGITVALCHKVGRVTLTEHGGHALANLESNVTLHAGAARAAQLVARKLLWEDLHGGESSDFTAGKAWGAPDIVLAADVMYDPSSAEYLAHALVSLLTHGEGIRPQKPAGHLSEHAMVIGPHRIPSVSTCTVEDVVRLRTSSTPIAIIATTTRNPDTFAHHLTAIQRAGLRVRDFTAAARAVERGGRKWVRLRPFRDPDADVRFMVVSQQ